MTSATSAPKWRSSYVRNNTKYPPIAKDAGIQGTVFVYFVVGKNGKVRDVKVLREVDPRLDKEAVRVVESLPTFEPANSAESRCRFSTPSR